MAFIPTTFKLGCEVCLQNMSYYSFSCLAYARLENGINWQGGMAQCALSPIVRVGPCPSPTFNRSRLQSSWCNRTAITPTTLDLTCRAGNGWPHNYSCASPGSPWPYYVSTTITPAHFESKEVLVFWLVLAVLTSILTILLNSATILVFIRSKKLSNSKTIIFAIHMAIMDILAGCVLLPMYTYLTYTYNVFRFDYVRITSERSYHEINTWWDRLDFLFLVAGFTNLAFMSCERCIVVLRPFWHMTRVTFKALILLMPLIWIYALVIYFISRYAMEQGKTLPFRFAFGFAVPTLTIIICYFLIIRAVRRASKQVASENEQVSASQKRAETKVTMNLLILKFTFLICWLPYFVLNFLWDAKKTKEIADAVRWAKLFSYFHAFLDPILYIFAKPNIREEIAIALSCKKKAAVGNSTLSRSRTQTMQTEGQF